MTPDISSTHTLIKTAAQTIREHRMIPPHAAILAGVSGGPDSICLLHVLVSLSQQLGLRIGIAHLNHGLRASAADREADFVRQLAERLKIPFFYKKTDIRKAAKTKKRSIEEAGRLHRYTFFNEIADSHGFDKIALGHHGDDNAELILMNLLRGGGPSGLSGIPPTRERVIRPLIRVSRSAIIRYLADNNLEYMTDQSNADPAFRRNKIRHELLPALKQEYNPNIAATLNRLADIFRAEERWFDTIVEQSLDHITVSTKKNELVLSAGSLRKLPLAPLRRILRAGIKQIKGDLRRIRLSQIDAAIKLLYNEKPNAWIDLPDQIRLEKKDNRLIVRREPEALRSLTPHQGIPAYHYTIHLADLPVRLWMPEIRKTLAISNRQPNDFPDWAQKDQSVEFLDFDRLRFPLTVRNPEPGDRFVPMGMTGEQKIKDYFINNKVPKQDRAYYPVVLSNHQIIWLAGHRIADAVKVTPVSQRLIRAELKAG